MNKILVAMSGGVDSSTTAVLLRERGYGVQGVTLVLQKNAGCVTQNDINDAAVVCEKSGILHKILDFSDGFSTYVIDSFVREYERGNTPNPCIECNRYMKFGGLFSYIENTDFDKIATGHYARIKYENGKYYLLKSKNTAKDQTYFLYFLTQTQLSKTLFPLGDFESKEEIREIAEKYGLVNARKRDSQDICFVDGDYFDFIEKRTERKYPHGEFVDQNGKILGEHKGIIRYTIGQRKGLGLALPAPLYVCRKDMEKNQVILSPESELFTNTATVRNFNWISGIPECVGITAKTRYSQKETPCKFEISGDKVIVRFDLPVRAVTQGQALVLYQGEICLGGGVIE